MSIDPFGEEAASALPPPPRPDSHVIGQDLAQLSIEELDERIAALVDRDRAPARGQGQEAGLEDRGRRVLQGR